MAFNLSVPIKRKKPSKALITKLENAGIGVKEALDLLNERDPYNRIKDKLELYLENFVTQRVSVINELFRAYGYKNICDSAERKCKRKIMPSIVKLIRRRHQIVHDGDYFKNGKLREYSQSQVDKEVNNLWDFVKACDEILFT